MPIIKQALFYLKVSRPGLWFATIWLYLLPTSQMSDIVYSLNFWVGLFYICFPLNFLVYGWNDIADYEIDKQNPRKDSFWFGARGSKTQLHHLWKPILISQLIFGPILIYFSGYWMALVLIASVLINWLYNLPKYGLRTHPPFELICQVGYLLVVPISVLINHTAMLPWQTYFYLLLFAIQSHLIGEVMDIEPDRKSGRKTTATVIGMFYTKLLIICIVSLEVGLLFGVFKDFFFGGILAFGLLWLLIDLFIIYKSQRYTLQQMKLFAAMSNLVAIVSMAYVWYSGCLLSVG